MGPFPRLVETFVTATQAQTSTLPYEFTPIEVTGSGRQLIPDLTSVEFVNAVGSYAVTVFSMMDAFSWLAIFVVLLLAAKVVWWLYHFVTEQPRTETLNLSGVLDSAGQVTGSEELRTAGRIVRRSRNPFR